MGKKFTDFINKMEEESKKDKKGFNPEERIESYRNLVNELYANIDSWLNEELVAGKILTGVVPITISEEQLGSYIVDEKWIQIGNARIQFHPIGTILIGTDARVDMVYRSKDIMIIRTGENVVGPGDLIEVEVNGEPPKKRRFPGKSVWKYVKEGHRLSYVTLDKDRFEDLIIEVVDGHR